MNIGKHIGDMGVHVEWNKEERARINMLKVIAMVFVVFIHSYSDQVSVYGNSVYIADISKNLLIFETIISKGIAGCGNSIFFFMSGLLFYGKVRKYKDTLKGKIKTLLIPYLFWNTFWILIFLIGQELPITSSLFSGTYNRILGCDFFEVCKLYGIGSDFPLVNQLWFLRDLIVITLITPLIWGAANRWPRAISLVAWGGYILTPSFFMKGAIFLYLGAASFIKLGGRIDFMDRQKKWKIAGLYLVILFLSQIINNFILINLFNVVSIFTFIYVTKWFFCKKKLLEMFNRIAPYTFIVFVLHNIPLQMMKKLLLIVFSVSAPILAAEYVLLPFIIVAGCVFAGIIFKRMFPKLYALSVGAR